MNAVTLALASPASIGATATLTRRAVDAWRARWALEGLSVQVEATAWEGEGLPDSAAEGQWSEASDPTAAVLFWPNGFEDLVANALYPDPSAGSSMAPASLARSSASHVAADLRRALVAAWAISTSMRAVGPSWHVSRWYAPVRLDLVLNNASCITAVVSALRERRGDTPAQFAAPRLGRIDEGAFGALPAHLQVLMGRASLPVPDIAGLQVGDVIVLDTLVHDPSELLLPDGSASLSGHLGRIGPSRGVQIVSRSKP